MDKPAEVCGGSLDATSGDENAQERKPGSLLVSIQILQHPNSKLHIYSFLLLYDNDNYLKVYKRSLTPL